MKARRRVFISYRRDDTAYVSTSIRDELEKRLGQGSVFFDVDSVLPGQDFLQQIEDSLDSSDVVLAVIGDNWNLPRERASEAGHDALAKIVNGDPSGFP